jgi:hypothetical protein
MKATAIKAPAMKALVMKAQAMKAPSMKAPVIKAHVFYLCSKGRASRNRGATSADCCRPDSPETREEVQASGKNYRHGQMANGVEEYLQGISHNLARF